MNVMQIGCGDLFEDKVVDEFNDCAVTRKGCVPQKADEGRFPIPPPVALVPNFNTTDFTGQWYISSGLNRTFDTFDCQRHEFSAEPTKLTGRCLKHLSQGICMCRSMKGRCEVLILPSAHLGQNLHPSDVYLAVSRTMQWDYGCSCGCLFPYVTTVASSPPIIANCCLHVNLLVERFTFFDNPV